MNFELTEAQEEIHSVAEHVRGRPRSY